MVIMILEKVPVSLRGELSKWLIEPKAGVFVGNISALVRDKLWKKTNEKIKNGGCMQIYNSNNEQGFKIRTNGKLKKELIYLDGLCLIKTPK
jgi:CRISPR-associated protein Cas2